MNSRKIVFCETSIVAAGELICCAAMVGVFALLGKFDPSVLLGAAAGSLLAIANFFAMALCANLAADRAEKQDIRGGQVLIQMSYLGRLAALFLVLILCARSGLFNLIALVIPLVFTRPVLTVSDFFNKKGGNYT